MELSDFLYGRICGRIFTYILIGGIFKQKPRSQVTPIALKTVLHALAGLKSDIKAAS